MATRSASAPSKRFNSPSSQSHDGSGNTRPMHHTMKRLNILSANPLAAAAIIGSTKSFGRPQSSVEEYKNNLAHSQKGLRSRLHFSPSPCALYSLELHMLFNLLSTPGEADRITEGVHQHRRPLRISALDKLGHIGVLGGFLTLDERKGFYSTRKIRHRIGDSAALLFSTFVIMFWVRQLAEDWVDCGCFTQAYTELAYCGMDVR